MSKKSGKIIIPVGMKPRPRQHEIDAAEILAEYFRANVEFIPTTNRNTPDYLINGVLWELKSPQGTGKNNIQRQLQYASHQSANVIIHAGRSKMHSAKIRREVERQFRIIKSIRRLLFISKDGKIIEIKR
ncbi:MAG TPA: hypothetical protein VGS08_05920 [Candidatus Saccharimonadales bacterium]|nr:hypothetical protein [Candidatus Saccharimonadales bacterium]